MRRLYICVLNWCERIVDWKVARAYRRAFRVDDKAREFRATAEEHRTCDDPLARLRSEAEQRARGQLLNHEPVRIHAMSQVTKSGIPLKWGTNRRDGKEHTEWHAPCGCAWHPEPAPHWHPCETHSTCREPVATVIDNNQTPGWSVLVETAPNVTLVVGTKLYR